MSTLPSGQKSWSPIKAISQWWRNWIRSNSELMELKCCGEAELERMAKDVGVSVAELHRLASRSPDSADLLLRRMAALDLDRNEVSRVEPRTFQDLQRVCTMCENRRIEKGTRVSSLALTLSQRPLQILNGIFDV
jgi:hypothetical protein